MLTFKPHDSILTTFKQQLIYNKGGWDRLRGCGVDFWVIILQGQKGHVNMTRDSWLMIINYTI